MVGIRIDANSEGDADCFTVMLDNRRPLISERSILLFIDPSHARQAMLTDDDEFVRSVARDFPEVEIVYDLPMTLYLLESSATDQDSNVLTCLNFVFDLLAATQTTWHPDVKAVLFPLADHLTFDRDLEAYVQTKPDLRKKAITTLQWSIGAIASHIAIFRLS